jgi:Trypsin-co-occurring domain 1
MKPRRGDEQMVVVGAVGSSELDTPVIYVEVSAPSAVSPGGSDWAGDDIRENRAHKLIESAHDLVGDGVALARTCAARFSAGLRELPKDVPAPHEVELQLGINFDAEFGAVLAKAKASAQLQLTLRWKDGTTP